MNKTYPECNSEDDGCHWFVFKSMTGTSQLVNGIRCECEEQIYKPQPEDYDFIFLKEKE